MLTKRARERQAECILRGSMVRMPLENCLRAAYWPLTGSVAAAGFSGLVWMALVSEPV
jgi:hypothetical protein